MSEALPLDRLSPGGNIYLVDLMGIGYGPIIATAVDLGAGPVVRCPACFEYSPLEDGWLGEVVDCPQSGCDGRMRVNLFVVNVRRPPLPGIVRATTVAAAPAALGPVNLPADSTDRPDEVVPVGATKLYAAAGADHPIAVINLTGCAMFSLGNPRALPHLCTLLVAFARRLVSLRPEPRADASFDPSRALEEENDRRPLQGTVPTRED